MCLAGLPNGVSKSNALVVLVINIFLPGIGTMIAGCLGTDGTGSAICLGIIQIVLAPALIGWIWAIVYGILLHKKASKGSRGNGESQPKSHDEPNAHYSDHKSNVAPPPMAYQGVPQQGIPASSYDAPPPPPPNSDYYNPQPPKASAPSLY